LYFQITPMSDLDLLSQYARGKSEEAFGTLVRRYTNLVYSAALRQCGNPHTSEEITQAVFVILARKARTLNPRTILSGWLLRTTRFVALNARRREITRMQTEQEAMNLNLTETGVAWKQIAPLLDQALFDLKNEDRDALALRFFEQKSFKEIAGLMGTSEDGAQKRVSRAVEKLRARFAKSGVLVPTGLVVAAIGAEAVQAAPAKLLAAGQGAITATLSAGSLSALGKVSLQAWEAARYRALLLKGAAGALILGSVVLGIQALRPRLAPAVQPGSPETASREPSSGAVPGSSTLAVSGNSITQAETGLRLKVVSGGTGQPVPATRLTLTWTTDFPNRATNVFVTGLSGVGLIPLDRNAVAHWSFRVEVFKDGFVPKYVSWSDSQGDAIEDVPVEYTTELAPAISIGGTVVDDSGAPIEAVRVVFSVSGPAPGASHDRERLTMMGNYHTEVTDAQGHWHCTHVPPQFSMITYEVIHPDYLPARFGAAALGATTNLGTVYVGEAELRAETLTTVLKRGPLVAGTLVNESGMPVAGAKVTENRQWFDPLASRMTGADGRFKFENAPPDKELTLTVSAAGFAPQDLTIKPGNRTDVLRLTLTKGMPLLGRVIDEKGAAIPRATVRLTSLEPGRTRFEWSAKTDPEGSFTWPTAPPTPQAFSVEASGFESRYDIKLTPDGSEHSIALRRSAGHHSSSFRLSGSALDKQTGKPIPDFQVLMGITEGEPGKATSTSTPELRARGKTGRFSFTTSGDLLELLIEVRAEGYLPARLTQPGPLKTDCEFNFELEHAEAITGSVQLPKGTPAVGAVVVLSAEVRHFAKGPPSMEQIYMRLPGQFDLTRSQLTRSETDSQGRFSLQPKPGKQRILVAHKSGFAEVSREELTNSSIVHLQPWARVTGILKVGNRPATNETVELRNWNLASLFSPSLWLFLETKTDDQGRFLIEGVPPGDWQLFHEVGLRGNGSRSLTNLPEIKPIKITIGKSYSMVMPTRSGPSLGQFIHLSPGQTAEVTLGGTGRLLIGKVLATPSMPPIDWQGAVQTLTSLSACPLYPDRKKSASDDAFEVVQQEYYLKSREFWLSEAGKKEQREARTYVLRFGTNGTFEVPDVAPGTYVLSIAMSAAGSLENPLDRKPIGRMGKQVVVPPTGDGEESEPFDLGELDLEPVNP
jgi:RNA polymerase sigma factor (sigma-70 family)